MNYKENLPHRVPEFLQNEDTELYEYLQACGEVFDDFSDTIKEHDTYKDYHAVPEARLSLLARRFAFNPPGSIPDSLMRGIVRDIAGIYTTKGVEQSLTWVFRLIGWGSTIEYAWLLNPEKYDPTIKTEYPLFFEREGLENDFSSLNTFFPSLGDGYKIGDSDVRYHADPELYVIDGPILIGRNSIRSITGEGNPYLTTISHDTTDFNKLDYRNFVYGEVNEKNKGAFFRGNTYFSRRTNIREAKIIGESYQEEDIIRYYPSVISTPYIVVKVDSEDYDRFTRPYVASDGTEYSYTTREKFAIAQTIIDYLLYEFVRPSNVRIILVASVYEDEDQMNLNDDYSMEATAEANDNSELAPLNHNETSYVPITPPVIGSENFFIGAPTYLPYNSLMQAEAITIGQQTGNVPIVANDEKFNYFRLEHEVSEVSAGVYETSPVLLRTPSYLEVDVDETVNIYARISIETDYVDLGQLTAGSHILDVFDYVNLKFRTTTLGATINTRVTWNPPSEYTGATTSPYVNVS